MPSQKHDRQYDIVVFGATGYTGKFTAKSIASHLPTDLKWAVAGRSAEKLSHVVSECSSIDPDRRQPGIEVCNLDDDDLAALARKTFILISTVGPFGKYGEHAFKACAENGTHYVDVTGEVPFVARMIDKYEAAARASGALMFPQCGVESSPADLITRSLAATVRSELGAPVGEVTVSIHKLSSAPSGGTLASALGLLDHFTTKELRAAHVPFALSPVANPDFRHPPKTLLARLTGLVTVPTLGLLTTSIAAMTDAAIVERTWGLLQRTKPGTREDRSYGPKFSYREYMRPRGWLHGLAIHYGLSLLLLVMVTPPLRALVRRFVYLPGEGPDVEAAKRDEIEFRGIAEPDVEGPVAQRAFARCWYRGSMYYCEFPSLLCFIRTWKLLRMCSWVGKALTFFLLSSVWITACAGRSDDSRGGSRAGGGGYIHAGLSWTGIRRQARRGRLSFRDRYCPSLMGFVAVCWTQDVYVDLISYLFARFCPQGLLCCSLLLCCLPDLLPSLPRRDSDAYQPLSSSALHRYSCIGKRRRRTTVVYWRFNNYSMNLTK